MSGNKISVIYISFYPFKSVVYIDMSDILEISCTRPFQYNYAI